MVLWTAEGLVVPKAALLEHCWAVRSVVTKADTMVARSVQLMAALRVATTVETWAARWEEQTVVVMVEPRVGRTAVPRETPWAVWLVVMKDESWAERSEHC